MDRGPVGLAYGLLTEGTSSLEVDRSRFLALAVPIGDSKAFMTALLRRRSEHPDASHHVWAWRPSSASARHSDDGEPQGTGGPPLLDLLERSAVEGAALIVTRYFGGRLLGRPRLLRAYRTVAEVALKAAVLGRWTPLSDLELHLPWALEPKVRSFLKARRIPVVGTNLRAEGATLSLSVPTEVLAELRAELEALSPGALSIRLTGTRRGLVPLSPS